MRGLYGPILAVLLASSALAAPPVPTSAIRLPVAPVAPSPTPSPAKAVSTLEAGQLYVIDSDQAIIVLASPAELVKITEMAGPATLFGKFVDGTGANEKREVKGKFIAVVEAATAGRVELLIVPVGATAAKDVIRVMLDVMGARPPPPKPDDPVVPDPKPVPVPVTSFRVMFVYDAAVTLTATQTGILNSKELGDWLNTNTTAENGWAGWRRKSSKATAESETPAMRSLWEAVQPKLTVLPCMVVQVNDKAEIVPFPTSVADGLTTLKKYKAGK